jgi:hypothetical protein
MQFIQGSTLQEKVDRSGPLPVKEILRIGLQTAAGLAATASSFRAKPTIRTSTG